jgi:hypothetical protein
MTTAIIAALDEVRGRATLIKVKFPDTCSGLDPLLDRIDVFMRKAAKGTFSLEHEQDLAEELFSVREFCRWLAKEYPETKPETEPLFNLINRLVTLEGPDL